MLTFALTLSIALAATTETPPAMPLEELRLARFHEYAAAQSSTKVTREDGKELTEDQRLVAERLLATEIVFQNDGSVSARYNFESKTDALLQDWTSHSKDRGAVRWPRRHESTPNGLLIADRGTLLHNANWINATVQVDFISRSGIRPKDLLAAVFVYDRGQRVVGSHLGEQCVQLQGLKRTRRCLPREPKTSLSHDARINFGFKIDRGVVYSLKNGKPTHNSHEDPKFAYKLCSGRAGLAWSGRVKGCVTSITIEGKLDPTWLSAEQGGYRQ